MREQRFLSEAELSEWLNANSAKRIRNLSLGLHALVWFFEETQPSEDEKLLDNSFSMIDVSPSDI